MKVGKGVDSLCVFTCWKVLPLIKTVTREKAAMQKSFALTFGGKSGLFLFQALGLGCQSQREGSALPTISHFALLADPQRWAWFTSPF